MIVISSFLIGCQTARPPLAQDESVEDLKQAVGSVAEAVSGESLTDEEVGALTEQIQSDPEAQSAIQSISDSYSNKNVRVKYNPQTGERFAPHMTHDPVTGVELKVLEDE